MRKPKMNMLDYHGSKWQMSSTIIDLFPAHKIYVEPFCGSASVLMNKPRQVQDIINDKDDLLINLFRTMRDRPDELAAWIHATHWSVAEFNLYTLDYIRNIKCDTTRAGAFVYRAFAGFGSGNTRGNETTGFSRSNAKSPGHKKWIQYPNEIVAFHHRLREVVIESKDALDVIKYYDTPHTAFYIDPPYILDTRQAGARHGYTHEMEDAAHITMLETLTRLEGFIVLSGYDNEIYNDILCDYRKQEISQRDQAGEYRVEVLWISPNCGADMPLFDNG